MFAIFISNQNYYFHAKGRFIVFNTEQEAQAFLQAFMNYAMAAAASSDPFAAIEVMQMISSSMIEPFDITGKKYILWSECSNAKYRELKDE